jgi:hypothetical protein
MVSFVLLFDALWIILGAASVSLSVSSLGAINPARYHRDGLSFRRSRSRSESADSTLAGSGPIKSRRKTLTMLRRMSLLVGIFHLNA